jgi:hypothetical protein
MKKISEIPTVLPGTYIRARDAPDMRPDNPIFIDIHYPAGYQILKIAGYPANWKLQL